MFMYVSRYVCIFLPYVYRYPQKPEEEGGVAAPLELEL